jgi:uncharacterized membrane protein YheB (UPF0754 family)
VNKSTITNTITFLLMVLGIFLENNILLYVGLFAFSGSITNTIAIHMLFEKVPFFYGSGVIESKFEEFKLSINNLLMNQFFTSENLQKFFKDELQSDDKHFDFTNLINKTDFTPAFISLKTAVMESSFGGMLNMFGGEKALLPLEEPFKEKLKLAINEIVHTNTFQASLQENLNNGNIIEDLQTKIDTVVKNRLDELTPKMVKQLVQDIIKEHLGWLVVWGAVFGGLIGFISQVVL